MDELEVLDTLPGRFEPAAEVVDRHRAQLRTAMQAGDAGVVDVAAPRSDDRPGHAPHGGLELHRARHGGRSRRNPVRAAAAVVVVAALTAGGFGLVHRAGGDPDETVAAGGPSSAGTEHPSAGGDATLACGEALPIDVVVPDGFNGPSNGPGGDAAADPRPDALVLHWASTADIVEVRWPADPDRLAPGRAVWDHGVPDDYTGLTADADASPTAGGRMVKELTAWVPTATAQECRAVQIIVSGPDAAAVEATSDRVTSHMFDRYLPPLIVGTDTAGAAPKVQRCRAPAGMAVPPNRGGRVSGFPTYPNSRAALQAFLEAQGTPGSAVPQSTLSRRGYREITLPDASVAYAYESTPDFVSTVIHVVQTNGGWTVADWEASGC